MKKAKAALLWIITAVICVFIAWEIATEIFPQPQFTVDLAEARSQVVTIYTYHDQGTPFPATLTGPDSYACDIPQGYWKNAYHLEFTVDPANNRVLSATINGEAAKREQIVHVSEVAFNSDPYVNTVVLHTSEIELITAIVFICLLIVLLLICLCVKKEIDCNTSGNSLLKTLLSGGTALHYIGKKTRFWALLSIVLSCAIAVGCDVDMFIGTMNLKNYGVNIYQLHATINQRYQIQTIGWPYNIPMLLFYDIGTFPAALFKKMFDVRSYHLWQYLMYKAINATLLMATIIGILSFLEKKKAISEKKIKTAFIWSFFNPVTYYVAIVFIQLDIFPICCLTLACLLLAENRTPVLAGILLAVGMFCKTQGIIVLPLVLILLFFVFLHASGKIEKIRVFKTILFTLITAVLFLLPNLIKGTPLSLLGQYMPHMGRIFYTTIPYAPNVFLYITPMVLILAIIAILIHLNFSTSKYAALVCVQYMIAAIILLFSFSMLSTPSLLLYCIAAFTVEYAFATDNLQRSILGGLSVLTVLDYAFAPEGDVLGLLRYFNFPYTFTNISSLLSGTNKGVIYTSLLFTIAHSTMLALGIYFCRKAMNSLHIDLD